MVVVSRWDGLIAHCPPLQDARKSIPQPCVEESRTLRHAPRGRQVSVPLCGLYQLPRHVHRRLPPVRVWALLPTVTMASAAYI